MSLFKGILTFFSGPESRRSSVIALIAVNLFPVYGILFMGWEIFPIMLLFWSENVIVGVFNVLRMLICSPKEGITWVAKIMFIPFFIVHYGMFTMVHGFFVISLFSPGHIEGLNGPNPALFLQVAREFHLLPAIAALSFSHAYSFVSNFIRRGEFMEVTPTALMVKPYARVVILHITLILGAFVIYSSGAHIVGLLLFIVLKIIVDIAAHLREHRVAVR